MEPFWKEQFQGGCENHNFFLLEATQRLIFSSFPRVSRPTWFGVLLHLVPKNLDVDEWLWAKTISIFCVVLVRGVSSVDTVAKKILPSAEDVFLQEKEFIGSNIEWWELSNGIEDFKTRRHLTCQTAVCMLFVCLFVLQYWPRFWSYLLVKRGFQWCWIPWPIQGSSNVGTGR